jgi:hypothetical protein
MASANHRVNSGYDIPNNSHACAARWGVLKRELQHRRPIAAR